MLVSSTTPRMHSVGIENGSDSLVNLFQSEVFQDIVMSLNYHIEILRGT